MALICQRLAASSCQTAENIGAVLRRFLPDFLAAHPHLPARKKRILKRMAVCRSGALGHAIYECSHCGQRESIPLGCGDRHCPCCQALHSRRWLEHQLRWLLPVPYYHLVFTLPHELHPLLLHNQQALYKLFFDAAAQSLLDFARTRLAGTPGITAVLHTWGQKLNYHPHLHCILTAGALSEDATQWRRPKQQRYLFPEAAVGALFRGKFMAGLRALAQELCWPGVSALQSIAPLYKKNWRVYLKRPFGGPEQVLAYLANYTHRVAIANSRIRQIDEATGKVTITYRDYADSAKIKLLKLSGTEFIRRFSLHLLPPRFTKIRHYGILGNNRKSIAIPTVRLLLHSLATVRLLLALARVGPPTPLQSAAHAVTSARCDSLPSVLCAAPSARDRLSLIHREPSPHSSQTASRAFRWRKTPPPAKEHSFCLLPKTELHRGSGAPANLQISPQPGRLKSSLQSALTTPTLPWKRRKRPPAPQRRPEKSTFP